MFGMGFMEILLIAVIAIVALGPDKLPTAMVEIAKFIKKFKSGVDDAKSTLDTELNINEMKAEANKFKAQIEDAKSTVSLDSKVDLGLDSLMNDDLPSKDDDDEKVEKTQEKSKDEKVSFKKKKRKKKKEETAEEIKAVETEEKKQEKSVEEKNEEIIQNAANKFKVNFDEKKEDNA